MPTANTIRPTLFTNKDWTPEKSILNAIEGGVKHIAGKASKADSSSQSAPKKAAKKATAATAKASTASFDRAQPAKSKAWMLWLISALVLGGIAWFLYQLYLGQMQGSAPSSTPIVDAPVTDTNPIESVERAQLDTEGSAGQTNVQVPATLESAEQDTAAKTAQSPAGAAKNDDEKFVEKPANIQQLSEEEILAAQTAADRESVSTVNPFAKLESKEEAAAKKPKVVAKAKPKRTVKAKPKARKIVKKAAPKRQPVVVNPPPQQVDPEVEVVSALVNIIDQEQKNKAQNAAPGPVQQSQPVVVAQAPVPVQSAPAPAPARPPLTVDNKANQAVSVCRAFVEDKKERADCIQRACAGKWGKVTACP